MRYENITGGIFLDRLNRFVAHVEMNGKTETVHVKNTGRCRELLLPGAEVFLTEPGTPGRKTRYDLVAVRKGNGVLFTQKLIRIYILQKLRKLQVKKRFSSIRKNLHKQMTKKMRVDPAYKIHIQTLGVRFSVCKVNDYSGIELAKPFCFIGATDEENSLVCPEEWFLRTR